MRDYEDLVKSLRYCAEYDCTTVCPRAGTGNGCITRLKKEAADVIEELSKSRWIPVTKALPEDGQWVLVWGHGQHIPTMMFRESGAWIDDQFEFHTTVTHWMPLPEPPKEDNP